MTNANEPAFPNDGTHQFASNGLTKREYFAAMALQGLLANSNLHSHDRFDLPNAVSAAINSADELLKQIES